MDRKEEFKLMLSGDFLYEQNAALIVLAIFALLLVASEIGFRRGRDVGSSLIEASRSQLSGFQGAMIGLLALLLGFSFALAESRFETQRHLVVEESNAIDTTYLRSQMLPEPYRTEIAKLVREYVEARLEFFQAGLDEDRLKGAIAKTESVQRELWSQALAVAEKDPRPVPTGLFITPLNDVIDLHAERDAARQNRVPQTVLWLLVIAATGSMGLVGYGSGVGSRRNLAHTIIVALTISLVILTIMDLNQPRRGLIKTSQQSMIALRQSLK
jgi:hypothetical protein